MAGSITPYSTSTMTNHGLLIVVNGQLIGAVTEWQVQEQLDTKRCYEFGTITAGGGQDQEAKRGEPYETVPGNVSSGTIRLTRYDIFGKRFEDVFGNGASLESLGDQDSAISLVEYINRPGGEPQYQTVYLGCWFTSLGRQHSVEGDRTVRVNADITFTRKRILQ